MAALLIAAAAALAILRASGGRASASESAVPVQVDSATVQRTIANDYLGLSIEYWALENYAGKNPGALNPVLVRLIRDLFPGRHGILRIGGVTTDRTWWPVAGFARPPGVNYSLNAHRLEVAGALARATGARLIMGINLEAGSRTLARAEARAMLVHAGRARIRAFELGNEPELFGNPNFAWYLRRGHPVTGRPRGYDLRAFTRDFARIGGAMPPEVPLAGPSSSVSSWIANLDAFLTAAPRVGLVTMHRYPFAACYASPSSPSFPTLVRLLSPVASTGQATSLTPFVTVAHTHHLPFAVDEMNSISCGNPPGLPNSFAMALWIVDALFADAAAGVDSVNVHTWPGAVYQLFAFVHQRGGWRGSVYPEYYGLLLFARATPPGSKLITATTGNPLIRAWATRGTDGKIRLLLINDDTSHQHAVSLSLLHSSAGSGSASIQFLRAPRATAHAGVSLAGQTFGATGLLTGGRRVGRLGSNGGAFSIRLPAASAVLLTAS